MCGILGLTFKEHREKLNNALNKMQHRGQDGNGIYIDEHVSLGHVRLSIIDLNPVTYPLYNEDRSIYVIVNGEFYNHQIIRKALMEKGHKFYTSTDAEIVLHLYEEYGADCVKHLNGEFAFILYDKNQNRIMVCRDRFGIKPLYYAYQNGEFYFASEIKVLIELGIHSELDNESLMISSSMQYCLPDKTLFKNINQVLPGHLFLINLETKQLKDIQYWDINFEKGEYSEKDIHDTLIDSIKTRMISDVPVCCALSGGLDSSIVYGVANQYKKTNAVTVAIEGSDFDESKIAERTAKHFNTNLHVLNLTSDKVVSNLSEAVYKSEGNTINSHLVAKFLLSKMIKDNGYKVVLTGEGSDELFCGYPHFKKDLNITYQSYDKDNQVSAGILNGYDNTHNYVNKYKDIIGFIPEFLKVKSSFGVKVLDLFNSNIYDNFNFNNIPEKLMNYFNPNYLESFNHADVSAYLWSKLVLSNYMLRTLGDGTEMAHTIEGRTPFLDYRLFDKAGRISIDKKIEGTIEKKILREIGKPYITEEVFHRVKQPFITPPLLIKERDFLYDNINQLPNFINKNQMHLILNNLYEKNSFAEYVKYEPVLYFIYSLSELIKRFKMKVDI